MFTFGIICLILGVAILVNPALLGFFVGLILLIIGFWILLGWYRVNKVLEKTYSVGKYHITFQKKGKD